VVYEWFFWSIVESEMEESGEVFLKERFLLLKDIFIRTQEALIEFMEILEPAIKNAKDDHERLYFHHIYEEEDHRLDRLKEVLPKLDVFIDDEEAWHSENLAFIYLLQDISLEKFGLHNFLEHLDLALFQFKDTEHFERLQQLRDLTAEDYKQIKRILQTLNEQFDGAASKGGSVPTDEKEGKDGVKISMYMDETADSNRSSAMQHATGFNKRGLTVGSLKMIGGVIDG